MKITFLNRLFILVFLVSCTPVMLTAQSNIIVNRSKLFPGSQTYVARQSITFVPNFSYKATAFGPLHAYIDPNSEGGVTYAPSSVDPLNYQLDKTLPVGAIPGSWGVGPTGSSSYTIPIAVPPGTGGMQPSLSISYNSMAGNGLLGMGWNLSGLSAITRTGQTIYNDGQLMGVRMENTDRFALDGMRLVKMYQGNYADEGSIYQTEMQSFTQVQAHGTAGTGHQYFTAKTKDGVEMEFGATADSRIEAQGRGDGTVLCWCINKIKDVNGNYITFTYDEDEESGQYNIAEIRYTGNESANLQPYATVKFHYDDRQDVASAYIAHSLVTNSVVLTKIEILYENVVQNHYEFEYTQASSFKSLLSKVSLFDKNNVSLNPTVFAYSGEVLEQVDGQVTAVIDVAGNMIPGDYNGDGIKDIMVATFEFRDHQQYTNGYKIYTRDITGNSQLYESVSLPLTEDRQINNQKQVNAFYSHVPFDFDGDGSDEVFINKTHLSSSNALILDYTEVYLSGKQNSKFFIAPPDNSIISPSRNYFFPGDFDGNGSVDFISILNTGGGYVPFFTGYGRFYKTIYSDEYADPGNQWALNARQLHVIDFDGDGKSELMVTMDHGTDIFTFSTQQDGNIRATLIYRTPYPSKTQQLYWGDFNGDGKSDFLSVNDQGVWAYAVSTGKFFKETIGFPFGEGVDRYDPAGHQIVIADIDGDGKSDVVHGTTRYANAEVNGTRLIVYFSWNDDFIRKEFQSAFQSNELIPVDLDGDRSMDLIHPGNYSRTLKYFSFKGKNECNLLRAVADGLGNTTECDYKSLTSCPKATGLSYPLSSFQASFDVVNTTLQSDGENGKIEMRYGFEGAVIHREGKGFLGFQKMTAENMRLQTLTAQVFDHSIQGGGTVYYGVFPKQTFTVVNGVLETETNYTPRIRVINSLQKQIFSFQSPVVSNDLFTGFKTTTTYIYDSDGNVETETTRYMEGETVVATTNVVSKYNAYNSIFKNRPFLVTVTKSRSGQSDFVRRSSMDYYSNGKLKTLVNDEFADKELTTTYTYDAFGNQKTVKVSAKDPAHTYSDRQETTDYEPKGRFAIKSTNALGHVGEVLSFEPIYGYVLRSKGANGLETSLEYDTWGRAIKSTSPLGIISTTAYQWEETLPGAQSKVTTFTPGSPESVTYYDRLGRAFVKKSQRFNGDNVFVKTEYTAKGQVYRESEPYLEGASASKWKTYAYDVKGRVLSISYPSQGNTSYDYTQAKQVTSSHSAGRFTTKKYDATGLVKQVTDNAGSINYTYDSNGQPISITAAGATTTIEYDQYGRQTKLTDPNAGVTLYEYNAFGELVYQKDAKNNSSAIAYDVLGRVLSKTGNGETGTTTYVYDTKWKGAVSSVSLDNGTSTAYEYDALGRTKTITETVGAKTFVSRYTYDSFGRERTHTYPSGLIITNEYNDRGYLQSVKRGSDVLWQCVTQNQFGQVTESIRGNGLTEIHNYDASSNLLVNHQVSMLFDRSYDFNPANGNLRSRSDNMRSLSESFSYDALDRLETIKMGETTVMAMNYNSKGNMTSKSDVGIYGYGVQPHALIEVVSPTAATTNLTEQFTTYTAFNKIAQIVQDNYQLDFTYGPDQQRLKTVLKPTNQVQSNYFTKYYGVGYERIEPAVPGEPIRELNYIMGGEGLIAIYVKSTGQDSMYYTYTDYLGSITHITDATGTLVSERSYDAWGRLRNPNTWAYTNVPAMLVTDRGYTGHEHHLRFGIINMNGRLYDPVLGRMFSPDNYVQSPDNTQSYNRYAYVWNNPLKYTDPSGDVVWFVPVLIGATVGVLTNGIDNAINDRPFFQGAGKAALIGGISGAFSFGIGQAAMGMSGIAKVGFQMLAHGHLGGVMSGMNGGTYGQGFLSGSAGSLIGGGTGALLQNAGAGWQALGTVGAGALAGGIGAEIAGGNFWDGARNGAISAGLNHAMHMGVQAMQQQGGDYKVVYNGKTVKVIDANGKVVWEGNATSGKGEHMNNPSSQGVENLGPIPEGEYSFSGDSWNTQSPARQLYNLVSGQGDWGAYNVKLTPSTYSGPRHNFYIHGGAYPGSAGCIDLGSGVSAVRNFTIDQTRVRVTVNYGR